MDKLIGEATLSVVFMSPSKKGSSLKEKNLLSLEANSFHLELPFSEEVWRSGKQTYWGSNSVNCVYVPSQKWVFSKRKEFTLLGSKFFSFGATIFQKKSGVQESKQKSTFLVKTDVNSTKCIKAP